MMQKRTLYLSLLLVSFLLVFGFSFATAQTVTIESKTLPRCVNAVLNVTVDNPADLSAFEIVLALNGNYSNLSFAFASGFTVLTDRVNQKFGTPDTLRIAAMKTGSGDVCLPAGSHVIGQITLKTGDVCSGAITISGATVTGLPCINCQVVATTGFVKCNPIEAIAATVTTGTVTIQNQNPTVVTCPGTTTVHWEYDIVAADADLTNLCETLTFTKMSGPGTVTKTGPTTAHVVWATGGDDVCNSTPIVVKIADKCLAEVTCSRLINVVNTPPAITNTANEINAAWGILIRDTVKALDPDHGPGALFYELVSFDGETSHETGFLLNSANGGWSWDIGTDSTYVGEFTLCIKVSDGANLCPLSPANADTFCYTIKVIGFAVSIEKVHHQLQGQYTTASIYLDSTWMAHNQNFIPEELLGGFDFLVAYDASVLTFVKAEPGALIDSGKFEYFTYRFGANGNCDGGCPSGLLRVVGMRESNNGVQNPYHIAGPGELVLLHFLVSNDRTYECQFAPIRFFWLDCGDNTLASEDGNLLYLGQKVFEFTGTEITDPNEYGYSGPADTCFEGVYFKDSINVLKNAPMGAIIFRNGGIDIVCADSIDARGDINLNGIANEIGDAVVFTNYFISGLGAFTVNVNGQIAATEVNGDGIVLSVADLVYLIRVIVGDVTPLPKPISGAVASFYADGQTVRVESPIAIGAALLVFNGEAYPTLAGNASNMEIKYGHVNGTTRVLVYSMDRVPLNSGDVININGSATLVSVEASDFNGAILETNKEFALPTEFALGQNFPNPFNPTTSIDLALPTASNWTVAIFNVSGQKVAEFSGFSEAGIVTVNWNADHNVASGLYFYKATAGSFSATKKMVLLK
jgi:hypothetical protein